MSGLPQKTENKPSTPNTKFTTALNCPCLISKVLIRLRVADLSLKNISVKPVRK